MERLIYVRDKRGNLRKATAKERKQIQSVILKQAEEQDGFITGDFKEYRTKIFT